tara:strand:+ start:3824 stop:4327 length:504 start_codon:yes stop_codon:yes gene_type:complete
MTENTKESKSSAEDLKAIQRSSRAKTTRNATTRRKPWRPSSNLDAPLAPEGYSHRWIRAEVRGHEDKSNISARMREGYELVRKDEYPDFEAPVVDTGKHEGVFGVGGLLLARIPLETVKERTDYFKKRHSDQLEAVDHDMMRENAHSTMAINKPDRQTRVTFGGPRK